jgi:hypothetical protein
MPAHKDLNVPCGTQTILFNFEYPINVKKITAKTLTDAMSKIGGFNALLTTLTFTIFGQLMRKDWIKNLSEKIRRDMIENNKDLD